MIACVCGGILEFLFVTAIFAPIVVFIKKLCKKRGCDCECHDEGKDG